MAKAYAGAGLSTRTRSTYKIYDVIQVRAAQRYLLGTQLSCIAPGCVR